MNKFIHIGVLAFLLLLGFSFAAGAQYNWKLSKDKGGIKVYESATKNSDFKKIKVECDLEGDYDRFISVMNDVSHYKNSYLPGKNSLLTKKNFALRVLLL